MGDPKPETSTYNYITKAARQHPITTKTDEEYALVTTAGNKYTGDDHLPTNEEKVENAYVFVNEKAVMTNLDRITQWHNIYYNIGIVSLTIICFSLFLK